MTSWNKRVRNWKREPDHNKAGLVIETKFCDEKLFWWNKEIDRWEIHQSIKIQQHWKDRQLSLQAHQKIRSDQLTGNSHDTVNMPIWMDIWKSFDIWGICNPSNHTGSNWENWQLRDQKQVFQSKTTTTKWIF